jgi:cytochrome c oxidase subunit 3
VKLGGTNTIVLICSSLTMAWGVRCAQLGKRTGLIVCLLLTLACAGGFMGIKYVEYSHKIHMGLLWGTNYKPHLEHAAHGEGAAAAGHAEESLPEAPAVEMGQASLPSQEHATSPTSHPPTGAPPVGAATPAQKTDAAPLHAAQPGAPAAGGAAAPAPSDAGATRSLMADAAIGPAGLAKSAAVKHEASPKNAHIFFGIYFAMTGLHGLHVLAGMVCITWLLVGAFRGRFGPQYFTPVDLVGLYWHIVDLIWIFLFPLLYLID